MPIGTFKYGWYPGNWTNHRYDPNIFGTKDPITELYSSQDSKAIAKQSELMKYAGINFSINSWWGQGTDTDKAFNAEINTPNIVPTCIYYEKEGYADIPQTEIINDINYIKSKYTNNSQYYKVSGKPVVFVYNIGNDISKTQKWKTVRSQTGIYLVLKVFPGWTSYSTYADSWHEYAPAGPYSETALPYSVFIAPGFWKYNEGVRNPRNPSVFETNLQKMKTSNAQFKLVETWNEYPEGSGIETTIEFGTTYLDLLHKYFGSGPTQLSVILTIQ